MVNSPGERRRGARLGQDYATARFNQVIWPLRADVLRVAYFLSHDFSTADDLSQEVLLKAFKAIDTIDAGTNVKAWLLAILRNAWLDRLRARASRPETHLEDLEAEPAAAEDNSTGVNAESSDPQELLNGFSDQEMIDALQSLPDEMRWTVLLIDVQGLSIADAARVLEVPPGTIKSRAHRGRGLLYEALRPLARELGIVDGRPDASESRFRQERP